MQSVSFEKDHSNTNSKYQSCSISRFKKNLYVYVQNIDSKCFDSGPWYHQIDSIRKCYENFYNLLDTIHSAEVHFRLQHFD